jgi:hypothetical protein
VTAEALLKAIQAVGPRVDKSRTLGAGGMGGEQVDA